jgi:hypothetical protein
MIRLGRLLKLLLWLVALVAQLEARRGLIQAGECWEGVAEPGEHEHPPNRRVGADERQVAACGHHLTQAANEHRQHHLVQEADPPGTAKEIPAHPGRRDGGSSDTSIAGAAPTPMLCVT